MASGASRSRRTSFRSNVVQTTGANLVIAALNLATGTLAARLLGPTGRGELTAIFSWPLLMAALTTLGMPDAIVYFCARQREAAAQYFTTALGIALAASVAFMAIGWVLMPVVLSAQSPEVVTAARWYLVTVPLAATMGMVDRPFRGIGDFRSWNGLRILHPLAWLAVLVVPTIRGEASPQGLAVAYLVARVALVGPMLAYARLRLGGRARAERSLASPLLRYGLPSFLTVLPTVLNQRLDQLLMAGFLPARVLGLYVVAVAWSAVLSHVMIAFAYSLFPRIASETSSEERRDQLFTMGLRTGLLLSVGVGLLVAPLTPIGIRLLFGSDFGDAVPAALILVVAAVVVGWNQVGEEGLRGLGRPGDVLRAELVGLATTLGALALLIARYEIIGAALASLLGYSAVAVMIVHAARRATGLPVRRLLVVDQQDLAAIRSSLHSRRRRGGPDGPDHGEGP